MTRHQGQCHQRTTNNQQWWKNVPVQLGDIVVSETNHYDNDDETNHRRNKKRRADDDLEAQPGEAMGMMYGQLQVLEAANYTVKTTPMGGTVLLVHAASQQQQAITNQQQNQTKQQVEQATADEKQQSLSKKARNKKKKRKANESTEQPQPQQQQPSKTKQKDEMKRAKQPEEEAATAEEKQQQPRSKTAKKNKKKRKANESTESSSSSKQDLPSPPNPVAVNNVENAPRLSSNPHDTRNDLQPPQQPVVDWQPTQAVWCTTTGGVVFHPSLSTALTLLQFEMPTPIQAATLAASILGRRNIVGAAPTGSGKTLAFMLPVCQYLLEQQDEQKQKDDDAAASATNDDKRSKFHPKPLQALILTPTRELALQISQAALQLLPHLYGRKWIGCIVGGLAHAKQVRVLDQDRPPCLVATVGRLWELLSTRNHSHLNDLSHLRFLIIDEADRMVQQGSFPQLSKILDAVQVANPMEDDESSDGGSNEDDDEDDGSMDNNDDDRMSSLPGIRGEARVQMLSPELLQQLEHRHQRTQPVVHTTPPRNQEEVLSNDHQDDEDDDTSDQEEEDTYDTSNQEDEVGEDETSWQPQRRRVHRQTFVYSATLTLPSSSASTKPKQRKGALVNVDGAIAEILRKARARGRTKIVDLLFAAGKKGATNDKDKSTKTTTQKATESKFRLPPGLRLQQIKCTQLHKDSHLYAYLMTTKDGASGPCLVFCNSIAAVRRVGATLQMLGLHVRTLHANMQQRARLKVVESLRNSKGRIVVVATDVAARGLDIPSVATVVHYDSARNVGTFVHRSGRTARGIGEKAVGCSLSLVASNDDKIHSKIVRELQVQFEGVVLDGRLLSGSQERVNLASKVVEAEKVQSKSQRENAWFRETADELGVELDEELLDDGLEGGDARDRNRLTQAHAAKSRLQTLLAQPLQTQRFGKFLSTNSAAARKHAGL